MPERPGFDDLPRRPAWVALASTVGAYAVGTLATVLFSRALEGTIGVTAVTAGIAFLVLAGVTVATALAFAARGGGAAKEDFGLASFSAARTLAWSALILAPSVALVWAAIGGTSIGEALNVPAILLAPGPDLAFGSPQDPVTLDAGVAVAALSFCVAPAIATELLLRGIVMPSLAPSIGRTSAAVVAALLTPAPFGLLAAPESGGPILAGALLAGLGISLLYLREADLYPGIATLAFGLGLAFGASLGWSAGGVAATALACALVAIASSRLLESAWPRALGGSPWRATSRVSP